MNMDHLKYLIEIGKSRTMVDAANKLYLAPQTLSMAIKKLESELNMQLVYRFPNGVKLSENGKWLAEIAEHFFNSIEKRKQEYQVFLTEGLKPPAGNMTLAVNMMGISYSKFTSMLEDIYRKYPQFDITVNECCRHDIEEYISSEKLDLGFIYRTKVDNKYVDHIPDELVFYPVQKGKLVFQFSPEIVFAETNENFSVHNVSKNKLCSYVNDYSCKSKTRSTLELITNHVIDYTETNSFSQYQAYILSGKYIGVTIQLDGDSHCANYIENCNTVQMEDNIDLYFGILRKRNKALNSNTSFIFNEVMKKYNLSSDDLTENVKNFIK